MRRVGTLGFTLDAIKYTLTAFADVNDRDMEDCSCRSATSPTGRRPTAAGATRICPARRPASTTSTSIRRFIRTACTTPSGCVRCRRARTGWRSRSPPASGSPERSASRTRAVVFDFDGVLADTERLHLVAFQDVVRRERLDARPSATTSSATSATTTRSSCARSRGTGRSARRDRVEAALVQTEVRGASSAGSRRRGPAVSHGAPRPSRGSARGSVWPSPPASLRVEILPILRAAGSPAPSRPSSAPTMCRGAKPAPDPYVAAVRAPRRAAVRGRGDRGLAAGASTVGASRGTPDDRHHDSYARQRRSASPTSCSIRSTKSRWTLVERLLAP